MRSAIGIGFVILGCSLCAAEDRTCHDKQLESAEPAAQLYALSPFVHGYRDGYQRGFHDADVDAQFAHPVSKGENMHDYREVHYRSEFGDRNSYVTGYRAGFLRGLGDMQSGLSFRLFSILDMTKRKAMPQTSISTAPAFHKGVRQGYLSSSRGAPKLQEESKQNETARSCSAGTTTGSNASFCAGIRLGEALASAEQLQPPQK